MADILPYLGVERSYSDEEAAGKTVILEDMTGMTADQARKLLQQQGLNCKIQGTEESVTHQIPAAGSAVPGDSDVILYFGQQPEVAVTEVPDFTGMNRQQASDTAGAAGLYILVSGNQSIEPQVVVTAQSEPKNTQVPVGTTIRLEFTDIQASD